jgi:diguanylate cyclase (GGDEF)-like protein
MVDILRKRDFRSLAFIALSVIVLAIYSLIDYSFFAIFADLITIFLALMIFIIALYSKEYTKESSLLYVGMAYMSLAFLDFANLVNYGGLNGLQNNLNAQGQLWIAARATEGFILYYAFSKASWKREFDFKFLFASFSITTFIILSLVLLNGYMPKIYSIEEGYNLYKYFLDFLVIVMFVVALVTISKNEKRVYNKTVLIIAISFKIIAEIIFVFETGENGILEASRYITKYISYVFLFLVFVKELLQRPFENIFMAFKKKEVELIELSKRDSLTGLYNHSTSYEILKETILKNKELNVEFCLMMIDIDDFKALNDKNGHVIGDEILSEIGKIFLSCEGPIIMAGRYGGDEFIALFDDCNTQKAIKIVSRIFERIDELSSRIGIGVTLSIGIAKSKKEFSAKDLVKDADLQLYKAKSLGKNTYCINTKSE